jgi:hypothetical protein
LSTELPEQTISRDWLPKLIAALAEWEGIQRQPPLSAVVLRKQELAHLVSDYLAAGLEELDERADRVATGDVPPAEFLMDSHVIVQAVEMLRPTTYRTESNRALARKAIGWLTRLSYACRRGPE